MQSTAAVCEKSGGEREEVGKSFGGGFSSPAPTAKLVAAVTAAMAKRKMAMAAVFVQPRRANSRPIHINSQGRLGLDMAQVGRVNPDLGPGCGLGREEQRA
jgi:hypothetical protein